MKKLVLAIAFLGFVAFGTLSIHQVLASSYSVELVKFDKDPKKDKKAEVKKEASADVKSKNAKSGDCEPADCGSYKASGCCSKASHGDSKESPDKK